MWESRIKKGVHCALALLLSSCSIFAKDYVWGAGGDSHVHGPLIIKQNDTLTINAGTITIEGKVVIQTNSVVNVTGDALIKSEDAPYAGSLHFDTKLNNVTLKVDANLEFQGADDGASFLITSENHNATIFSIAEDKKVSFNRGSSKKSGGAWCLVVMSNTGNPTIEFKRQTSGIHDATVFVGHRSKLGYVSHDDLAVDKAFGTIKFDPTNDANGRLVLEIDNRASVVISPVKSGVLNVPDVDDIDFKTPGGGSAVFEISNSAAQDVNAHAGLLVLNHNSCLSDLLFDPYLELCTRKDTEDYNGIFSGVRWGFVLGNNGHLSVGDNAYLDYVGLANNQCPECKKVKLKLRNPSAFIVDGSNDPLAKAAEIIMGDCAGIFFRSGVDASGNVASDFTVAPEKHTRGAGEIVFDVEGPLAVNGSNESINCKKSKLEIVSLQVAPTGASLFISPNNCPEIFPARTFATDDLGNLLAYNTACWLVNNSIEISDATIAHTDVNHTVIEKNDAISEPAYIGGEFWHLINQAERKPSIAFYNASLFVHENIAFTGLDLKIPNMVTADGACVSNTSKFVFFQNGKKCDNGTGRQMVLGTEIGSKTCGDCPITISRDAHLDIMPDQNITCIGNNAFDTLILLTAANNNTIVPPQECVLNQEEIAEQPSIQTIFLGHESNISIGLNGDCDLFNTPASSLLINGNFFSFATHNNKTRNTIGRNGIFVDCNGSIIAGGVEPDICFGNAQDVFLCRVLVSMGVMVVKSHNGVVNLPKNRVFFDSGMGISEWHLNLNDPLQQVIIDSNDCLSEYCLNWLDTQKDFDRFCPFQVTCYDPCGCPAVEDKNVSSLPIIKGRVDQLQIKGSRLGDQAHIAIDGGIVKELLFIQGNESAQAPVGVVVLENSGSIGLGSAHRNVDSLNAAVTLGVNGVTVIANGAGQIVLNEDIIVNNICHLLKGPDFNKTHTGDVLTITSECCRTMRVKSDGILDLSSFKSGDTVTIAGDVKIILEPGARLLLNGGQLRLEDRASIVCEPAARQDFFDEYVNPNAGTLRATDSVRVKISGSGTITLAGCSSFFVDKGAYLGVETWPGCNINQTAISLLIVDSAQMLIGNGCLPEGGSFQIGDTEGDPDSSVIFSLSLIGPNATFAIDQQGFFGLGVGIVDKSSDIPNDWLVQTTYNVNAIAINILDGIFKHNLIFSGDNDQASLLAIGGTVKNFLFDSFSIVNPLTTNVSQSTLLGGGNFVRINPVGPINPTVLDEVVTSGDVLAGMLTSKPLLPPNIVTGTIDTVWNQLRIQNITAETSPGRAAAGPSYMNNFVRVGYVDQNKIGRDNIASIIGTGGTTTKQEHTLKIGAIFLVLVPGTALRPIAFALELQ